MAAGADRCASCGHAAAAVRAAPVIDEATLAAAGETLEVCRGCGVVALPGAARCEVCDAEHESPRLRVPRLFDGRFAWVAVRTRFECRSCGHKSPLNHLDLDESVLCVACGVEQAFKSRGWERPLKHAHGVADLSGPSPEGRFPEPALSIAEHNPFADVGVARVWAFSGRQGKGVGAGAHESLEIEAAPGHPLCDECRTPLAIAERTNERLTLRCPACGADRRHPLPPQAQGRVAGVLTTELANERRDVGLLVDAGGAVAVTCPYCSAPLDLSGACTVVTCRYCSVTSRLPSSVLLRLGFKSVRPLVWWMLFEGPSSRRVEANGAARGAQKRRAREGQRAAGAGRATAGGKKAKGGGNGAIVVAVVAVVAVVVGIVAVVAARG